MKYTIIVPTYNRFNYIKRCIDSVLNQTYSNLELIVIDDGSTDDTSSIINKYNDKRLKYFKNENHGIGYSRNYGIDKATGDFVFFLDSDDYLEENMLEEVNKVSDENDIIIFNYYEIIEKNNTKNFVTFPKYNGYTLDKHPEIINEVNLGPCNKLFKKDLFKDKSFSYPEDIKYEDFPLLIKLFKEAKNIISIDKYLTNYTVHEGNETLTVDEKVFDIFKGLDMVKETLNDDIYKEELNKLIVRKITTYTVSQRTQKCKNFSNKFIDEAFIYLKKSVPDYKNNKYYKDRSLLKRLIEKNKNITKIYCKLYRITH